MRVSYSRRLLTCFRRTCARALALALSLARSRSHSRMLGSLTTPCASRCPLPCQVLKDKGIKLRKGKRYQLWGLEKNEGAFHVSFGCRD